MTILLGLVAGLLAFIYLMQRRMIYFPMRGVGDPAAYGLDGAETVSFPTDDGLTLRAWFVPARGTPTGHTAIVLNGNAGHRGHRTPLALGLSSRGLSCLLMDYRGYGDNRGSPSEDGLTRDARAARAYVAGRRDVDPRRLVYFGESLGAGVAVRLATEHPPAALVLRSPFTSLADAGRRHYPFLPVRWILRDRYPAIDLIAQVRAPVLVIAGTADRIVFFEDSRRLFEAAVEPKAFVPIEGADHNDAVLLHGAVVVDSVAEFVRRRASDR